MVGTSEAAELNQRYRGRTGPTNVLSFPFAMPDVEIASGAFLLAQPILGDIVLCAPLIRRESMVQGKRHEDHWAHLVVHGVLHLLGYDHADAREAETMEARERAILASFGIADPYQAPAR